MHGKDIQFIKLYLANTCYCRPLCSVFSTDMHSSSLGARPGVFLCRHKLSSQCALHKHHNLNNLGIRQEIWQNLFGKIYFFFFKLFGKIDFQIHKNLKNRLVFLKVFGKIDFHYAGEVTHPIAGSPYTHKFSPSKCIILYIMLETRCRSWIS